MEEEVRTGDPLSVAATDCNRLESVLIPLAETLDGFGDIIDGDNVDVRSLKKIASEVREYGQNILEKNRLLRLGIVGQVKAGKSSLLNLLLFDGQEVLPKAATPMTAALTHIIKGDTDEIEIEYYSQKDWGEIERYAKEYRNQQEEQREKKSPKHPEKDSQSSNTSRDEQVNSLKASHELVEQTKKQNIAVKEHLGKKDCLPVSMNDLNQKLREHVGAEGSLTPLVKSVTIRCSQGIPDLDIVDTPGINDPILSRSRQANNLLGQCDAVLLLSYAGQFLTSQDVDFYHRRTRRDGISRRLLIGSKFDSALVDVGKQYKGDLSTAIQMLEKQLTERVDDVFSDEKTDGDKPVLVSTLCATLASKPTTEWSEEEHTYFGNLRKLYPDYLDQEDPGASQDSEIGEEIRTTLTTLGNRGGVNSRLTDIRRDKDEIIQGKARKFVSEKQMQTKEVLGELIQYVEHKREDVKNGDIKKIEKQKDAIEGLILKVGQALTEEWEIIIEKRAERLENKLQPVRDEIKDVRKIITDAKREETYQRKVRRWYWSNYFVHDTRTVLDINQIRIGFDTMGDEITELIRDASGKIFSVESSRAAAEKLSGIVNKYFYKNTVSDDVNVDFIIRTLKQAIRELFAEGALQIEEHSDNAKRTIEKILDEPDELSDTFISDPDEVQNAARKVVKKVLSQHNELLDDFAKIAKDVSEKAAPKIVPTVRESLDKYHQDIQKLINDRKFILQRCDLALEALKKRQAELN